MSAINNDVTKLRNHLFDTLDCLKNKTIDIERAKAICEVSQTIINSAKVEVDFAKVTGKQIGSTFLPAASVLGVTTHRMKG